MPSLSQELFTVLAVAAAVAVVLWGPGVLQSVFEALEACRSGIEKASLGELGRGEVADWKGPCTTTADNCHHLVIWHYAEAISGSLRIETILESFGTTRHVLGQWALFLELRSFGLVKEAIKGKPTQCAPPGVHRARSTGKTCDIKKWCL